LKPRTYAEIGVRNGSSLTLARWSLNIGVDPALEIREPIDRRTQLYPGVRGRQGAMRKP